MYSRIITIIIILEYIFETILASHSTQLFPSLNITFSKIKSILYDIYCTIIIQENFLVLMKLYTTRIYRLYTNTPVFYIKTNFSSIRPVMTIDLAALPPNKHKFPPFKMLKFALYDKRFRSFCLLCKMKLLHCPKLMLSLHKSIYL